LATCIITVVSIPKHEKTHPRYKTNFTRQERVHGIVQIGDCLQIWATDFTPALPCHIHKINFPQCGVDGQSQAPGDAEYNKLFGLEIALTLNA
jgi:hypothetical protein